MTEQGHLANQVVVILEETKQKLSAINSSKINWSIPGFIEQLEEEIFDLQSEIGEIE